MSTFAYHIKGFPDVSERIELPNIAELLLQPMYGRASAEDVYRYGGEIYRHLLDKTPLKNDRRYVSCLIFTQLLYPGVRSIHGITPIQGDDWHRDGSYVLSDDTTRSHLLLSDCSARTEFNEKEMIVDLPNGITGVEFNRYINEQSIGFVGRKIESERFITFSDHIHRRTSPEGYEFRFTFRITESDSLVPYSFEKAKRPMQTVVQGFAGNETRLPNIEQVGNRIIIYTGKGGF